MKTSIMTVTVVGLLALAGCTSEQSDDLASEVDAATSTTADSNDSKSNETKDNDKNDKDSENGDNKDGDANSDSADKDNDSDSGENKEVDIDDELDQDVPAGKNAKAFDVDDNPEGLVRRCGHDPEAGPNPFGMRAYLTAEQFGSDSYARYDNFGNAAGEGRSVKVTDFPDTPVEEVLEMLEKDEELFLSIIGQSGPEATKYSDLTMVCNPEDV